MCDQSAHSKADLSEPDLRQQARLVRRMAGVTGVDIDDPPQAGVAPCAVPTEVVHNCATCAAAATCPGWLAAQERRTQTARAPEFCHNRAWFEARQAG